MWQNIAFVLIGLGVLVLIGWSVQVFFMDSEIPLLIRIATGAIGVGVLVLIGVAIKDRFKKAPSDAGISITGIDNIMVRFAKCFSPLPGDDIIGCVTRGRGITIHVSNCRRIQEMETERIIAAQWNVDPQQTFAVGIRATCKDKKGLSSELSSTISSLGVNMTYVNIDTTPGSSAICNFQLDIKSLKQLNLIISELKKLKSVLSVERVTEPFNGRGRNKLRENVDTRH